MGLEIKDLAGLEKPLTKLVEVISAGLGTAYKPRGMRNEADAKAYEILAIAKAEAAAGVIASQGQAQAQLQYIETLSAGDQELLQRAQKKLIHREIEAQRNVEAIAEAAIKQIPNSVATEPVSTDWRRQFFLEAEGVSDSDMQELWGRVLAGEVSAPGSFSSRSLTVLKTLSRGEAETFRVACTLANAVGELFVDNLSNAGDPLKKYGLHYGALMALEASGLLHSPSFVLRQFQDMPEDAGSYLINNNGIFMKLSGPSLRGARLPVLAFTAVGRQLQKLNPDHPNLEYLRETAVLLRSHHGLTVTWGDTSTGVNGCAPSRFVDDI